MILLGTVGASDSPSPIPRPVPSMSTARRRYGVRGRGRATGSGYADASARVVAPLRPTRRLASERLTPVVKDRQSKSTSLHHQDPVKGILMKWRQLAHGPGVAVLDGQRLGSDSPSCGQGRIASDPRANEACRAQS
jgi:hypothetical protein